MAKIYRFTYKGTRISYSHHSHPFLGRYTAVQVGRKGFINSRINKKGIIKYFDEFKNFGEKKVR
jgi:hypothetical protein